MQLVSFSVSNYRSITSAHKLRIAESTILIGPNNEGKSNILQALVTVLRIVSELGRVEIMRGRLRSTRFIGESYDWDRDFPIGLQASKPDGESVFRLEFALTGQEVVEFRSEVKSNLNGTLPIQISIGQKYSHFKVMKKGPGGSALSRKASSVARFIGERIDLEYIPAVRTAESATRVVEEMVTRELRSVELDEKYRSALDELSELQRPVLERLSQKITDTLKEFLPNVDSVQVKMSEEARYRALRRSCEIIVDDGTPTPLRRKGDGVQSLAALSLLRGGIRPRGDRDLVLAIEEPESHLHPEAIHRLRSVIDEISTHHQVILTTHCPLFVDRVNIRSNIIVRQSKATAATDIAEIRDVLGVRASDNLRNAALVLIVEGELDRTSIAALLAHASSALRTAIEQNTLVLDPLHGASNLTARLYQLRDALCTSHCFLDNDQAGHGAEEEAHRAGLLGTPDIHFAICDGMKESEMEDMLNVDLYAGMVSTTYGVDLTSSKFRSTRKWSDRMDRAYQSQGKRWTDTVAADVKRRISELVEANPGSALNVHKRSAFDALKNELEVKLEGS